MDSLSGIFQPQGICRRTIGSRPTEPIPSASSGNERLLNDTSVTDLARREQLQIINIAHTVKPTVAWSPQLELSSLLDSSQDSDSFILDFSELPGLSAPTIEELFDKSVVLDVIDSESTKSKIEKYLTSLFSILKSVPGHMHEMAEHCFLNFLFRLTFEIFPNLPRIPLIVSAVLANPINFALAVTYQLLFLLLLFGAKKGLEKVRDCSWYQKIEQPLMDYLNKIKDKTTKPEDVRNFLAFLFHKITETVYNPKLVICEILGSICSAWINTLKQKVHKPIYKKFLTFAEVMLFNFLSYQVFPFLQREFEWWNIRKKIEQEYQKRITDDDYEETCNGSKANCSKRLDEARFVEAHNAAAIEEKVSADSGILTRGLGRSFFDCQKLTLTEQLKLGITSLALDVRLNDDGNIMLTHANTTLGIWVDYQSLKEGLDEISEFLNENPRTFLQIYWQISTHGEGHDVLDKLAEILNKHPINGKILDTASSYAKNLGDLLAVGKQCMMVNTSLNLSFHDNQWKIIQTFVAPSPPDSNRDYLLGDYIVEWAKNYIKNTPDMTIDFTRQTLDEINQLYSVRLGVEKLIPGNPDYLQIKYLIEGGNYEEAKKSFLENIFLKMYFNIFSTGLIRKIFSDPLARTTCHTEIPFQNGCSALIIDPISSGFQDQFPFVAFKEYAPDDGPFLLPSIYMAENNPSPSTGPVSAKLDPYTATMQPIAFVKENAFAGLSKLPEARQGINEASRVMEETTGHIVTNLAVDYVKVDFEEAGEVVFTSNNFSASVPLASFFCELGRSIGGRIKKIGRFCSSFLPSSKQVNQPLSVVADV